MSSLSSLLSTLFTGSSDYCCLCFTSINGQDTPFSLMDEVSINIEETEELFEIISTVFGDQALDCLTTKTVCRYCTEQTITCYRFITRFRTNINMLQQIVHSFEQTPIDVKEGTNFNKLFVSIRPDSLDTEFYYDENEESTDVRSQLRRFHNILEENRYTLNIEFELDDRSGLKSVQLSDILYDKDNLQDYKCKFCLKQYETAVKLKQHYVRMHASKDFKCTKCPKSFGSLYFLKRHTQYAHCTVVCSECGKTYTNLYSLRYHELSHKQRLVCQTCGKIYKAKQAFNNHVTMNLCQKIRKSNAEAKFICNYCGKKYAQKTALSVHIRLEHENGKSVICEWCNKKFSAISRLNDHMLTHTKTKKFECDICGGRYVSKTSLLYHTRTHTGEKPYKCEHCDMAFISISRRTAHEKTYHMLVAYECDICHNNFKTNTCLRRHRIKHFDVNSKLYHKPQDGDKVVT